MLDDKPNVHRAFVTDTESDARHVIVTIAIRGVASFEMLIPMDKYDPFLMLELLGSAGVQ